MAKLYRPNVAIVIIKRGKVLLFERSQNKNHWQFPQGGIDPQEDAEEAMWRELWEETGLAEKDCKILAHTKDFLYYDIPTKLSSKRHKIQGQKQMWFLVKLNGSDKLINLKKMKRPEFRSWRWVSYWSPLNQIIEFKRDVYHRALLELLPTAVKLGA